jgi:hypothetical protein
MTLAVKYEIVRREQEQAGYMRTFYVVNPEVKGVLQRVLPEILATQIDQDNRNRPPESS